VFYLNRVGKMCVLAGLVVGFLAWFILSLILANNPLTSGVSVLIGTTVASMADIVYRALNDRDRGIVRLVHSGCGGTYLSIPVWCIGLIFFAGFGHWLFFER
jgi:hypothetical protein